MYLWKFHATRDWLAQHEHELATAAPGQVAIIDRPGRARSIVQVTCSSRAVVAELVRRFGGSFERLPRAWESKYRQQQKIEPLRIGRRLVVVAEPRFGSNEHAQLVIPAAGAFRTGEHATTAMSLRLLEEITRGRRQPWQMLDLGTGTGILALAARSLGASEVVGFDLDPRAVAHARANARLNKIRRARFVRRDVARWKSSEKFDVITANLFSELLIAITPQLRRAMQNEGKIILSGILRAQAPEVVRALGRAGFRIECQRRRGKWLALLAEPKT